MGTILRIAWMITLQLVSSGGISQAGRMPEPAIDRAPSVAGDTIQQQDQGIAQGTFSIKVKVDLVTVDRG